MTIEEVDYMFGGINHLSKEFRMILARAVSKIPQETSEWAAENLLFVSSTWTDYAFSLMKKDWAHKSGFVFLCENLKEEEKDTQLFSIAHEIAHHKLKHKNPIFGRLTIEETRNQEREANKMAEKWIQEREE